LSIRFHRKTEQQIIGQFNDDMQYVVEQDKVESAAITYAIENNSEIQSPFSKIIIHLLHQRN
jgi:hypothetical protein